MSRISSGRKRRVLRRIRRRIDEWARTQEPGATWISDTQLEFPSGAVLDMRNMVRQIEGQPREVEEQIVDHYFSGFLQSHELLQRFQDKGEFTPEEVMGHAVKVIVPAEDLDEIPTTRLDDSLSWAWGLDFDGVLVMQPLEDLEAIVGHARLEAAVEENIKERARQCEVVDFGEGLVLTGPSKVLPSVALYLAKCARFMGLPPCADGYFLGMPSRTELIIVQGDRREILPAVLSFTIDLFSQSNQPLSPWLFHTDGDGVITNLRDIPDLADDDVWFGPGRAS